MIDEAAAGLSKFLSSHVSAPLVFPSPHTGVHIDKANYLPSQIQPSFHLHLSEQPSSTVGSVGFPLSQSSPTDGFHLLFPHKFTQTEGAPVQLNSYEILQF